MSFSALIAPARQAMRMPARSMHAPFRALHASTSAQKKKSNAVLDEDPFAEAEEDDDLDLFAGTTSTTEPITASSSTNAQAIARRTERAAIIERIKHLSTRPRIELVEPLKHMRIGDLRKVISYAESREDLEVVEKVLKAWRYFGKRVTQKTMDAFVGRCAHLGYPEFALRLYADPATYGLPTMIPSQVSKIHLSYARAAAPEPLPPLRMAQSLTPENAIYRLAALSKYLDAAAAASDGTAPKIGPKQVTDEILAVGLAWGKPASGRREETLSLYMDKLEQRGGEWKAAVDRIRAASEKVTKPPVGLEGRSLIIPPAKEVPAGKADKRKAKKEQAAAEPVLVEA